MSRDEILALPAGRELDRLVALRVAGWTYAPLPHMLNDGPQWQSPDGKAAHFDDEDMLPRYSTDIAAAWQVLTHMDRNWLWQLSPQAGGIEAVFWRADTPFHRGRAEGTDCSMAPLAICRAALLAVMEEKAP